MTKQAENPENWVFGTLLDYFKITSSSTMAELYSRGLVDMPQDVFQEVSRRVESFVNSQLGRYDMMDRLQFDELQRMVAAVVDGIFCTAAGLHSFDNALLDYMAMSAKPIFKWLREHGLAFHYFSNNTFSATVFPADLFMQFFNAAGLIYACPQNAVWFAMQNHGVPWEMFDHEYERNKAYGKYEYGKTTKMAFAKGLSSIHLIMDGGAEDFPEFNEMGGTDGHVVMLRDELPKPGTSYATMPCRRPATGFQ